MIESVLQKPNLKEEVLVMKHSKLLIFFVAVAFISASALALGGCSAAPGANVSDQTPSSIPTYSQTHTIDKLVDLGSVKMKIATVSLIRNTTESQDNLKGHIALGLVVGNTSNESVRFYPEQFVVTTNTGEKLFADTSLSSDVGGLLPPQRVLEGFVMFQLQTSNPDDVKELKVKITAPQNEKGQPLGQDQELVIPMQQA